MVSSKPALAAHRECLIKAMDGICVRGNYVSQDPDSLIDINIREYGHLIRITDSVAEFFYRLHCAVKPHFTSSVESDTMENCLDIVKKNTVLFGYFASCFPSVSQENPQGICSWFIKAVLWLERFDI